MSLVPKYIYSPENENLLFCTYFPFFKFGYSYLLYLHIAPVLYPTASQPESRERLVGYFLKYQLPLILNSNRWVVDYMWFFNLWGAKL